MFSISTKKVIICQFCVHNLFPLPPGGPKKEKIRYCRFKVHLTLSTEKDSEIQVNAPEKASTSTQTKCFCLPIYRRSSSMKFILIILTDIYCFFMPNSDLFHKYLWPKSGPINCFFLLFLRILGKSIESQFDLLPVITHPTQLERYKVPDSGLILTNIKLF